MNWQAGDSDMRGMQGIADALQESECAEEVKPWPSEGSAGDRVPHSHSLGRAGDTEPRPQNDRTETGIADSRFHVWAGMQSENPDERAQAMRILLSEEDGCVGCLRTFWRSFREVLAEYNGAPTSYSNLED